MLGFASLVAAVCHTWQGSELLSYWMAVHYHIAQCMPLLS